MNCLLDAIFQLFELLSRYRCKFSYVCLSVFGQYAVEVCAEVPSSEVFEHSDCAAENSVAFLETRCTIRHYQCPVCMGAVHLKHVSPCPERIRYPLPRISLQEC